MKLDEHPHDRVQVKHNIKIDHPPSEEDYGQKIDWMQAAAVVACAFLRGVIEGGELWLGARELDNEWHGETMGIEDLNYACTRRWS